MRNKLIKIEDLTINRNCNPEFNEKGPHSNIFLDHPIASFTSVDDVPSVDDIMKGAAEFGKKCDEIKERTQYDIAKHLLEGGLMLIPSPFLQDHQFIVSQGIFEAARKIGKENEKSNA